MKEYIQKYRLVFSLLFLLAAVTARGQRLIDSIKYTTSREEFTFNCTKAVPIDLFKVAKMYVSPEHGYWGDVNGVPYNGKPGASGSKERQYTNGNIFTPPVLVSDTGWYKFYFYFTSSKNYCGITQGTRFILDLYLGVVGCLEAVNAGELDNTHYFCYGVSVDLNPVYGRQYYSEPVTIANLLLTNSKNKIDWKKNKMLDGDWVDIDVYPDMNSLQKHENRIGNGDMEVDLRPKDRFNQPSSYDTTFYVIIHQSRVHEYVDSITITVYPKSQLEIFYSPDIVNDVNREYSMDDKITITVDTSGINNKFDYYTFFLNRKDLNKYYFGGDTTRNEITLDALTFTGVEDFLEIVATDKNKCIVRSDTAVIVRVPFPTVFTPDGDGINDVFLGGEKFRNREFHLEIYSRWGPLLYSGESGWDGTYRGEKAPPGTYPYVLKIKASDGSTRTIKDHVTLIRQSR
jgi:gliding motility-associated-like protein